MCAFVRQIVIMRHCIRLSLFFFGPSRALSGFTCCAAYFRQSGEDNPVRTTYPRLGCRWSSLCAQSTALKNCYGSAITSHCSCSFRPRQALARCSASWSQSKRCCGRQRIDKMSPVSWSAPPICWQCNVLQTGRASKMLLQVSALENGTRHQFQIKTHKAVQECLLSQKSKDSLLLAQVQHATASCSLRFCCQHSKLVFKVSHVTVHYHLGSSPCLG